jgi:hypothetical protein
LAEKERPFISCAMVEPAWLRSRTTPMVKNFFDDMVIPPESPLGHDRL